MKKVLFATTALVMTAGAAAAEVSISGSAEMGIYGGTGMETQFFQDLDVAFTMTGETDGGLTFGANVDLDENAAFAPATHGGASIFISGAFGTVTLGDIDGALDWAMQDVGLGGSINDDHTIHAGYYGNNAADIGYDGQVLRYDHAIGDIAFAVSALMDDTGVGDAMLGVGVKYNANLGGTDLGLGFGYQTVGGLDIWGISADATFGNMRAIVNYTDVSTGGSHTGVGVSYSMDALTLTANYGEFSGGADGYGLVANYDLGGGAVVQFGYGSGAGVESYSLGVAMSF